MKVRLITSLREFDRLAPLWRELAEASGQMSPFASHDWFACCWRAAGPHRRREVMLIEDSAGPLALIPLARRKTRMRGLPVRVIEFLDSPDTAFADFPVAREVDDVIAAFLGALRASRDWDVLSLSKVPTDAAILKSLETSLPGQFGWRVAARQESPFLAIEGRWEDFFRRRTQRFRKTCRSIENRISRGHAVSIEEHTTVDPDGPIFADLVDVSLQSWKASRGVAIGTMPGMTRFFRELTQRASANGWLHLWILRLDGRPVATEYQIGAGGRMHALRADFDGSLNELSPGGALNLHIVRSLFGRRGFHEYDMGPGTNEYKLRWASGAHETATLSIVNRTLTGQLVHWIETRLVPVVRRGRARVGA